MGIAYRVTYISREFMVRYIQGIPVPNWIIGQGSVVCRFIGHFGTLGSRYRLLVFWHTTRYLLGTPISLGFCGFAWWKSILMRAPPWPLLQKIQWSWVCILLAYCCLTLPAFQHQQRGYSNSRIYSRRLEVCGQFWRPRACTLSEYHIRECFQ